MDQACSVETRLTADPVQSILAQMQQLTITSGWDVVCAMEVDRINDLLAQQYVQNLQQGSTLPPINATVPLSADSAVQIVDLTLGPPLIRFDPDLDAQQLYLTINFISGVVNTVQQSGEGTTLLGTQVISPGDEYSLTGVVPLTSVAGEVQANHDVVIDIANGSAFTASLGLEGGAATTLGQYFLGWLQANVQNFQYKLGTLVCTPGGTDLTPTANFEFATQFDATDPNDKGRLVLFIPTTYNPEGGKGTSLSIADIVPQGYSAALLVSSQVLFANILEDFFQEAFGADGVTVSASQADKNPERNYTLRTSGGQFSAGEIDYFDSNDNQYASGTSTEFELDKAPVIVPFPATTIESSPDSQISIAGASSWGQPWVLGTLTWKSGYDYTGGTVGMHAAVSCNCAGAVDSVRDVITFTGTPSVSVTYDPSNTFDVIFGTGGAANIVGQQIVDNAMPKLDALFTFSFPQVNVFAVSNLLFPAEHALSLSAVYVPGDLVIFGNVQKQGVAVTPVQVTLAPGQTQQFTASGATSVKWAAQRGAISAGGLYTAPAQVLSAQTDVISANGAAVAVVTLVPGVVLVSPSFTYLFPASASAQPQQFSAAGPILGSDGVTWSIAPQLGEISSEGKYTPPWSGVQGLQAVTITATSKTDANEQGVALVVLAENSPGAITVTPPVVSALLAPGQSQQFTATGPPGEIVNWSVLPAGVGTISANGLYTAPAQVTSAQPVLIVAANSQYPDYLYGSALVMIAPA